MVFMEKLTKGMHFIPVKTMYSTSDVAHVFIRDGVRLHGALKNIVLDRDVKFTSMFGKSCL